jgi:hypothetical protein
MTTGLDEQIKWLRAFVDSGYGEVAQDTLATIERLNSPVIDDFLTGTAHEATHQIARWGAGHDADKVAEDWFWLVGMLAGKALRAHVLGDRSLALHHTISTAAVLFHWHRAITETGRGLGGVAG